MAISTFKRYEIKFFLSAEQYNNIKKILPIYMKPDAFCKGGKTYSIYNIYYDTPDSFLIRTSLSSPYYKEKFRVRSYRSMSTANDRVFLELKKKTAGIVHKRRATMTMQEAGLFLQNGCRPEMQDYLDCQVTNELKSFLKFHIIRPAVYISYQRAAFFGKDDREFRVTFDSGITTRRIDLNLHSGDYGEALLQPGQYLMEVKVPGAMPLWLTALLSELRVYKTSFSKYGMEYRKYCGNQKEDAKVPAPYTLVDSGRKAV